MRLVTLVVLVVIVVKQRQYFFHSFSFSCLLFIYLFFSYIILLLLLLLHHLLSLNLSDVVCESILSLSRLFSSLVVCLVLLCPVPVIVGCLVVSIVVVYVLIIIIINEEYPIMSYFLSIALRRLCWSAVSFGVVGGADVVVCRVFLVFVAVYIRVLLSYVVHIVVLVGVCFFWLGYFGLFEGVFL